MGGFFGAVSTRDVSLDIFLEWTITPTWAPAGVV